MQRSKKNYYLILPLFLLLQAFTFVPDPDAERLDYETCRILVERNEILSFAEINAQIKPFGLGRVIDMMLLRSNNEYLYEMEVAGDDGVLRMIYIDARTGDLMNQQDKLPDTNHAESFWKTIIDSNK